MKLYILGNGGFAHELLQQLFYKNQLKLNNNYEFGGFITKQIDKYFVTNMQGVAEFDYARHSAFIIGTCKKEWRNIFLEHFTSAYKVDDTHFPNVYSNTADIAPTVQMGVGNVFCSHSLATYNAILGNFNCFNSYASIFHDSIIGHNNILSPYASITGYCKLGNNNFLAAKALITPKISIGNDNTISAAECVFDNISDRQFFQSGIIYNKK